MKTVGLGGVFFKSLSTPFSVMKTLDKLGPVALVGSREPGADVSTVGAWWSQRVGGSHNTEQVCFQVRRGSPRAS